VASLSLSALCYQEIYKTLVNLASKICNGRLVSVLEGGYSIRFVGKIAAAAIAEMAGAVYMVNDETRAISKRNRRLGEKVIRDVKEAQRVFWNID
jgi:acetoin utilization deacetylase AcuC-like enzyme